MKAYRSKKTPAHYKFLGNPPFSKEDFLGNEKIKCFSVYDPTIKKRKAVAACLVRGYSMVIKHLVFREKSDRVIKLLLSRMKSDARKFGNSSIIVWISRDVRLIEGFKANGFIESSGEPTPDGIKLRYNL